MDYKQFDFYQKLKIQIGDWLKEESSKDFKWRKYVAVLPDCFHFVSELATDNHLPIKLKEKLAKAMAYVISPYDFLPEEEVGPAGFLDDVTVCAVILNEILPNIDKSLWNKYWGKEYYLLPLISGILQDAEVMLGKNLLNKILDKFSSSSEEE